MAELAGTRRFRVVALLVAAALLVAVLICVEAPFSDAEQDHPAALQPTPQADAVPDPMEPAADRDPGSPVPPAGLVATATAAGDAALAAAPPVAVDGFDQAFGLFAGAPPVASKQGWMCCLQGQITLHSSGILDPGGRFVVAVLTSQPRGVGYDGARATVTAVADAVRATLA